VPIERELERRGVLLRGTGHDRVGSCPKCGGDDRFSISTAKQLFNCRGCGLGGDVIKLVEHLDGVDFITACTTLTGEPPKANGPSKSALTATYDYTDADGALLYQVLRFDPKTFRQRRPGGNGHWIWKLDDRRVLYRLRELLKCLAAIVFVCEGEKDADRVASLGHCATTVAGGKWTEECIEALAGRDVIILEDNDEPGRKKALAAAQALYGSAKTIRIVGLPDLTHKGDVSDWLDADLGRAERLVETCFDKPEWIPDAVATVSNGSENEATGDNVRGGAGGRTQADILIELARGAELFRSPDDKGFADLMINGHRETWPIRSKQFRRWLARGFFEMTGGAPNSDALQSALNLIEAKAHFDSPERSCICAWVGWMGEFILISPMKPGGPLKSIPMAGV
jgi:hypothetical protein